MLALVLETGLRPTDVAYLQLSQVDWQSGLIALTGGVQRQWLLCGERSLAALQRYAHEERASVRPQLFLQQGKPFTVSALTRWAADLGERAGVGRISWQTLRDTFTAVCTQNGLDLAALHRDVQGLGRAAGYHSALDFFALQTRISGCGPLAGLRPAEA